MDTPNPNPNSTAGDLPAMISVLRDLAIAGDSTLHSISSLLSLPSSSSLRCPFNPHHRVPPESLFRHSISCSSAPKSDLLSLLDSLHYPTSLAPRPTDPPFHQSLPLDPSAELCFSLEAESSDLGVNFFYRDCPGVVTTPEADPAARTFTLPGFLAAECANFVADEGGGEGNGCCSPGDGDLGVLLPSDYWALKSEVEGWSEFPGSYSCFVLRVASRLGLAGGVDLRRWVICSSPRFGILVDAAMGEHICLLLKLCMRVVGREACCSVMRFLSKDGIIDLKSETFRCDRLVGSLNWLASQLSILYSEVNAKLFANEMLKQSLLEAGMNFLSSGPFGEIFGENGRPNDRSCLYSQDSECEPGGSKLVGESKGKVLSKDDSGGEVFVSQVAAAIAALHERSMLEERIRAVRYAQPMSKSQLILEHMYASARGCEERAKRPNYRPIIEYDGLLWHRSQHQDSGKTKTMEELLAEERDYKRRRVSYRGKKVKRNPVEVLRDIIEEHMEEIMKAEGSNSGAKNAGEKQVSTDIAHFDTMQNSGIYHSEARSKRSASNHLQNVDSLEYNESSVGHDVLAVNIRPELELEKHKMEYNISRHDRDKYHPSRSSSILRSGNSYDRFSDKEKLFVANDSKYERKDHHYSYRSKDTFSRSSTKYSRSDYEYTSGNRSKRGKYHEDRRSESMTVNAFEDRYQPYAGNDDYVSSHDSISTDSDHNGYVRQSSERNHPKQLVDHQKHDR